MLQNPSNITFSGKKAPAAVHHTHTGHKNPRNVMFSKKKKRHISIYVYRETDIINKKKSKNHEFIFIFLKFWRSAAEAAACKYVHWDTLGAQGRHKVF